MNKGSEQLFRKLNYITNETMPFTRSLRNQHNRHIVIIICIFDLSVCIYWEYINICMECIYLFNELITDANIEWTDLVLYGL